ncbi:Methylenetetrahydrofolate--tRNA-(uracil-5-)-methyltransferase TrmFO [Candidatus Syntrophocurvum alkaliphilum]|uniref:Methylenetetrahydrofolate--tRNA-(uracil-5-)-methyltransferase TrmFO n=1 Tax=Candidatus Syntrophocurvum alkaliphilum TaxID=2293317 RepID=A0A6I6DCR2_9FIRM|nr:methylenetetrahydrofolate--tRNA-(uracil(54)-C(5))-methyltransferase (FADH(2)-oxidizing) TrmFO [Candidatus Syntrophocurvum alkaliphilum]QGT99154.1 Methylenetetrahydrofolate--tRNA-(uracil-5-)-methyltransferase TrmFO [Candidatus Syntrophocurvum alkaliphilum]
MQQINVIGGGLAGSEAAYAIANCGVKVKLWEMRPNNNTPVHQTSNLAELVCSNSLKSELIDTSQGLLKKEMSILGSLLLKCAESTKVPAGSALAVDRELFSKEVTKTLEATPNIEIIRDEVTELDHNQINLICTGPLTSKTLHESLQKLTGEENLYFFDAVAPSITAESLDKTKVFKASRYNKGTADYYNCPFTEEEYNDFYQNLIKSDIKQGHSVDKKLYFSGCMPIEVIAHGGIDSLRYGPLRPVGLIDPRTGQQPYAVLQLRQEDRDGNIYGLVGFQTRLKWGEQDKVFRLIPGLEQAEFIRYGVMHRNTFINSPKLLLPTLQLKQNENIFFAGQITGVEGYMESAVTGIIAGINAVRYIKKMPLMYPNRFTMTGALIDFITTSESKDFQPINANFGLIPPLEERIKNKKERYKQYSNRAIKATKKFSELFLSNL